MDGQILFMHSMMETRLVRECLLAFLSTPDCLRKIFSNRDRCRIVRVGFLRERHQPRPLPEVTTDRMAGHDGHSSSVGRHQSQGKASMWTQSFPQLQNLFTTGLKCGSSLYDVHWLKCACRHSGISSDVNDISPSRFPSVKPLMDRTRTC